MDEKNIEIVLAQGGGVPGGHYCISHKGKKPFITPMQECASIELRHSDVVVDIGAYVGTYAIRAARFPVKKVVAYEPTPLTFKILDMTELPNLEKRWAAVVGDHRETIDLHLSKGIGVTNSILESKAKPDAVTVPAVNYSEAVKDATIVKIDVEGGEYTYDVDKLVSDSMRAIIIDFHPVGKDWIDKSNEMIRSIEQQFGFEPVIYPNWENGWTRAGSWIRDMPDAGDGCAELLEGHFCCGCGCPLLAGKAKSICRDCADIWSKKHRKGFEIAD